MNVDWKWRNCKSTIVLGTIMKQITLSNIVYTLAALQMKLKIENLGLFCNLITIE